MKLVLEGEQGDGKLNKLNQLWILKILTK